ncbi:hypothetical protein K7X08_025947 [Anisodus acutangulus]|uniref:Putative plant transposon protein domain-containing protein n=1 Tax=Anisodus acutangulus TaxID=402998 RepID=A0A9Q1N1K8_9SOLA|nr:hypothetical protein K7X08_025947 [Anisodus acutangulus]
MMKNLDDHGVWAASFIAKETPDWIDPIVGIHKNTLTKKENIWLAIITSSVLPSFSDTNIVLEKAIMIVALMTGSRVNVGEIIQDEIRDRTVDYNRLEHGNKKKTTVSKPRATPIVLDTQILSAVDQPASASTSVPATTKKSVLATSLAIASIPVVGQGIPSQDMRLIRLVEAKVTKLVEEFSAYVKKPIKTTLAPHKAYLEAVKEEQKSISAQLQSIKLRLGVLKRWR